MRSHHSEPRLLPGLASTLGLLVIGIGIFSGAAHSAVGGEPESEPTLSYGAPGLEATHHGLVFVKRPPSCERDRLLLFWDAGRSTQELEKVYARVQFDLGDLRLHGRRPGAPRTQRSGSRKRSRTDPRFHRARDRPRPLPLRRGKRSRSRSRSSAPSPCWISIASIQQNFDISQLNAQRNQTHAQCEAQTPATPTKLPLAENSLMS